MPPDARRWHHAILTTYGAWLRGDPRGFRTRHHRQHIEGDYKRPPEVGQYVWRELQTLGSMPQPEVTLLPEQFERVATALDQRLTERGCWVLCIAVSSQHVHLLVKIPARSARNWLGIAKKHATFVLRDSGVKHRIWGKRSGLTLVRSRRQQINTYRYILRHAKSGAWVGVRKKEDGALVRIESGS